MEFLGDYSTDDGTYVKAYSNGSNSIQFNVSLPNDTADNNVQRFETTSSGICDGMVGEYGAPNYIDWWVFCDNKVVFATKSEKQADGTYSFSGVSCADSKYQAAIDDFKNFLKISFFSSERLLINSIIFISSADSSMPADVFSLPVKR